MHSKNNAFEKKVVMVGASYYIPKVSEQHSKLSGGMKGCISVTVGPVRKNRHTPKNLHQRKP
jgi:hypothetical protein